MNLRSEMASCLVILPSASCKYQEKSYDDSNYNIYYVGDDGDDIQLNLPPVKNIDKKQTYAKEW